MTEPKTQTERAKLIEKADEFRNNYDWQGTRAIDPSEMECEAMADFALNAAAWTPVNGDSDLPTEPRIYLFTIEHERTGKRKVTLTHLRNLWVGQKVIAYMELPAPYEPQDKSK
jgi:hypothetical protein